MCSIYKKDGRLKKKWKSSSLLCHMHTCSYMYKHTHTHKFKMWGGERISHCCEHLLVFVIIVNVFSFRPGCYILSSNLNSGSVLNMVSYFVFFAQFPFSVMWHTEEFELDCRLQLSPSSPRPKQAEAAGCWLRSAGTLGDVQVCLVPLSSLFFKSEHRCILGLLS